MLRFRLFAIAVSMAGFTGPVLAGNESRFEAFALSDTSFEVVAEFSENAIYWCGASIYTRIRAGRPATQRIYVLRGPGRSTAKPGAIAVRFGFSPPPGAENVSTYTNSVTIVGNRLSAAQAQGGCTERSSSG